MCPSSPRQTWSSNLNHTASQLFQVASPRADQRRLMWMERKSLGSPSQVSQKSEAAAWTPATTLLSYLCIDSSQCLVPWYAYFLDKGNEQCHHRKVVSSTRTTNLNATYGVVILSDKSFAALQHFVQIIQVPRNIHHKGKVLQLLWDEILTLACIFFHEVFNFLT